MVVLEAPNQDSAEAAGVVADTIGHYESEVEDDQSLLGIAHRSWSEHRHAQAGVLPYELSRLGSDIVKRLHSPDTAEDEIVRLFQSRHRKYTSLFLQRDEEGRNLFQKIMAVRAPRRASTTQRGGGANPAGLGGDNSTKALFLQYLVLNLPQVLVSPARSENEEDEDESDTKLWAKMTNTAKALLFLVLELLVSQETLIALAGECIQQQPPPEVVLPVLLSASLNQPILPSPIVPPLPPPPVCCQIDLHRVLVRQFRRPDVPDKGQCIHQLIDTEGLEQANKALQDALTQALLNKETGARAGDTGLHRLLEDAAPFLEDPRGKRLTAVQRLIERCPAPILMDHSDKGLTPLHMAIRLYRCEKLNFDLLNGIIRKLVERAPDCVYVRVEESPASPDHDKSPYMLLQDLKPKPGSHKAGCHEVILKTLRHVCIGGSKSQSEKQAALYGSSANVPKLFLDLAHVSGRVDRDYVETMAMKVKRPFVDALEYVRLPRFQQSRASRGAQPKPPAAPASRDGSPMPTDIKTPRPSIREPPQLPPAAPAEDINENPYVEIFSWLRTQSENKVEKIFKVTVDDLGDNPHSDEAIIDALAPFDVKTWDWMKFDVCSDTIRRAAPGVQQVYLHSSGNNAVLRSWSGARGLMELKFLQKVTITMHPGKRETAQTLRMYLEDFKTQLGHHMGVDWVKKNLVIRGLDGSKPRTGRGLSLRPTDGVQQTEDEWITKLAPFRNWLKDWTSSRSLPELGDTSRVRIALIDNGVDINHPDVGEIEAPESFCDRNVAGGFRDFCADPCTHGTQMAICIQKVCPMAKLYVARLNDPDGEFTVASCVAALRWAKSMDVDIISMSWSFLGRNPIPEIDLNAKDAAEFKAEVESCRDKILLFASLNDANPDWDVADSYPVGLTGVFKIGSAKLWGAKANHHPEGKAEYLFPGQDIPMGPGQSDGEITTGKGPMYTASGSSLATAFAAGLAGLLVQALKVHLATEDTEIKPEHRRQRLETAKTRDGMARIFNRLAEQPPPEGAKDIRVAYGNRPFPTEFFSQAEDLRTLRDFLNRIAPRK